MTEILLMSETLLTPAIQKALLVAKQKEMVGPLLLFLSGHRPLAFVTGQLLHLGSPFGSLLGMASMHDWATLLSHPEGPSLLEAELNSNHYAMESQPKSDS